MNCPICKTSNTAGARSCTNCGSDLEVYGAIDAINSRLNSQKRNIILLAVVLVVAAGAAAYGLMNMNPGVEEDLKRTSGELETLKASHAELQTKSSALEAELQSARGRIKEMEDAAAQPEGAPVGAVTEPVNHMVVAGETLATISQKYFGSEDQFQQIGWDNNIVDPERLYAGTSITINPKK